jgi:hypothetical protein
MTLVIHNYSQRIYILKIGSDRLATLRYMLSNRAVRLALFRRNDSSRSVLSVNWTVEDHLVFNAKACPAPCVSMWLCVGPARARVRSFVSTKHRHNNTRMT